MWILIGCNVYSCHGDISQSRAIVWITSDVISDQFNGIQVDLELFRQFWKTVMEDVNWNKANGVAICNCNI